MDIWLTICKKTVPKCSYCGEPIYPGEVMVAGRIWKTKDGKTRRWVKNLRWHGQKRPSNLSEEEASHPVCCWLEAGLEYLRLHPQEETRGRKQLQLTPKEKTERLKILRQRARLVQKLKTLMEIPLENQSEADLGEIIKIGSQIEGLKERIVMVGGQPPNWA